MNITHTKIVAVFAHPDDEAFGPGGTLAKLAEKNAVYLLCATRGEAGNNHSDKKEILSKIRSAELSNSAKILGIHQVDFLDFEDGALSNNLYHQLAQKIQEKLEKIKPAMLITYEPRGVSGHIDHIVVSLVTTFVFYKLPFIKKLFYFCLNEEQRKAIENYFIYLPPGYKRAEINKVVNVATVWDKKITAIKAHESQMKDIQIILSVLKKFPKEEYFLELKK